ncbi:MULTISPECIES: NapC/NirT family cytochrome c [Persephonella]|uniref:Acetyl-coenzyme A carboxylase carboxyl transferase subunit alpha n=1 Tax=Persephonella marina (strain DSM 14350 / EX-H1) TaxID=123214 RepID=C0QRC9_PERMH|nr:MULTISPECIES: NapC/NirT family cytochrome c [Persephonella]ACO04114.1 acetyl-coenzyme A carboxylase carboxyl transferase subunit alpha [Persephonella marina EX-H1]
MGNEKKDDGRLEETHEENEIGGEKKAGKKGFLIGVSLLVAGVVIGLVIAYIVVYAVKLTGGAQFCKSCHPMQPMYKAYSKDTHGGWGRSGFVAHCTDCHLPHDSIIGYLVRKVQVGLHDFKVMVFGDPSKVNWHEKREHRRYFVYDSGCLHCHENLLAATMKKKKAFIAHKAYFSGKLVVRIGHEKDKAHCVDCHKHVGHKDLGKYLPPPPPEEKLIEESEKLIEESVKELEKEEKSENKHNSGKH